MANPAIPEGYYDALAKIESGGDPLAKAATSSASGLYQFTKGTWERLGYVWSKVFDVNLQNEAVQKLTNQNANYLQNRNIPVNSGSLYAAHFLGPNTAAKVLGANPNTPISNIVSDSVIKANSFLKGMTVGDFINWVNKKMGSAATSSPSSPSESPSFFSSPTAWLENKLGNLTAIVIGVILIGLAVAAFTLKSDIVKEVVQ